MMIIKTYSSPLTIKRKSQYSHLSGISRSGAGELERALVKGFSNMARENNAMTGQLTAYIL